jgi:hypothetical protein
MTPRRQQESHILQRASYDEDGVGELRKERRGGRISRTGLAHRRTRPLIAHETARMRYHWPGEDEEGAEERQRER